MLSLFTGPIMRWVVGAVIAAAFATVASFVYTYDARGRKIVKLETEISRQGNKIKSLQSSIVTSKEASKVLGERLGKRSGDLDGLCATLWKQTRGSDSDAVDTVLEELKLLDNEGKDK